MILKEAARQRQATSTYGCLIVSSNQGFELKDYHFSQFLPQE